MKPLSELQTIFSEALKSVYGAESDKSNLPLQKLAELIHTTDKLPAPTRVEIYGGSYFENLISSLAKSFPAVQLAVGQENFRYLAVRFIKEHPSQSQNIHHFGGELSAFIAQFAKRQPGLKAFPYLADLARLEWIWEQLIFAPDDLPFDWQALARLSPQAQAGLQLQLSKSLQLLELSYQLHGFWQQALKVEAVSAAERPKVLDDSAIAWQTERLVAWRHGYEPRLEVLSQLPLAFLRAIRNNLPLEEALLKAAQALPGDDLTPLGQLLPEAVKNGWVVAFTAP